ncbi:MAG: glycosyltransferase [Roseivirga sp.]|nr:glycosyltransferase [Roseivirga sp.]
MSDPENFLTIIFMTSLFIQLMYHWRVFQKLPLATINSPQTNPQPVSVLIAARNEEENLPRLLKALKQQKYPFYEVIVINDRSDDGTATVLEEFSKHFSKLKTISITEVPDDWTGKKNAIKQGIDASSHELLLFTDADCYPKSESWIAEMTSNFESGIDIVLGFSPYREAPTVLNQFIRFETLHTGLLYLSHALAGRPYMGVGRNMAYRKALFEKAGFAGDEKYTGGDDDIFVNRHANKKNAKVVLSEDSQMVSIPEISWAAYLKQKIRHLSVGKRYHKKDKTSLANFSLATLVGWILFIYLLLVVENKALILVPFAVRSWSFYSIFTRSGQKLKVKLAYWALPLFDLCYTISYPVVGLIALTAKRIKWS